MDIHRCRFIEYNPASIHSIAFSHSSPINPQSSRIPPSLRCAIGRSNGSIEIWNPLANWFHETTLYGGKNRSIEGLAWIRQSHYSVKNTDIGRLFSIGNSTVVTEWDLVSGRPLAHFDCGRGVCWSIAAKPKKAWFEGRQKSKGGQKKVEDVVEEEEDGTDGMQLAVGCEDGSLVIISTEGGPGDMQVVKVIPQSTPCRILSVAYQSANIVIAGTSDSRLRVFDIETGRIISTMTVSQRTRNKGKKAPDTYVWTVKCIPGQGGWIVAGDSRGELTLWDGKRYALRQTIKSHAADILALETNSMGTQIFSTGIDRKTVNYELVKDKGRQHWVEVSGRRFHQHDVRAMASFESGMFSVLVSGGVDMTPIVVPLRNWFKENHYTLPALPQQKLLSVSPSSRLIAAQTDRHVEIWKLSTIDEIEDANDVEFYGVGDEDIGRRLVGKIVVNSIENISSSAISPNGELLAISTMASLKLFQLRPKKTNPNAFRILKVELPERAQSRGYRKVIFSPNNKFLCCVSSSSDIYILKISSSISEDSKIVYEVASKSQLLDRKDREVGAKKLLQQKDGVIGMGKGYERLINDIAFSPDGKFLAAADLGGWLESWKLENGKWGLIKATLPRLPASAAAIAFKPALTKDTSSNELFVVTTSHSIHDFNILDGNLTEWGKRNSFEYVGQEFQVLEDRCTGMFIQDDGIKGRRAWLWGNNWFTMINLDRDLKKPKHMFRDDEKSEPGKKRDRTGVVMSSGAGSATKASDPAVSRRIEMTIVGEEKKDQDVEIEAMDVDSEDEFLVDRAESKRTPKILKLEQVESEESSSESEEQSDDDSSSSADSSDSDSDSGSDKDEASDSELSVIDDEEEKVNSDEKMDLDPEDAKPRRVQSRSVYVNAQYRSLLGVLPIGNSKENRELVIIERPLHEIKLPPKFMPKRDIVKKFN